MSVQMRQFDRVKEKVEIRLDNRQIGGLIIGCLAIAAGVFFAGFQVGQDYRAEVPADTALAFADTTGMTASDALASPVATPSNSGTTAPSTASNTYTYDRVLTAPAPRAKVEDPTLQFIANTTDELRRNGGETRTRDLAGPRPLPEAVESEETVGGTTEAAEPAVAAQSAEATARPAESAAADAPGNNGIESDAPASDAPTITHGYTIQVKAFRENREARQFMNALSEAGYKPYLLAADVPGKGRFYRVRLGRFSSLAEATTHQTAFEDAEGFSTIVTQL